MVMMMWEEGLMEEVRVDWEECIGEGGEWERLQGSDTALCSWEHSAMAHLQREYGELGDEFDDEGVNGREWGERAGQWLGLMGELSERMEGYEERVGAQRMSGRRREWQERMEEQREWERLEEERQGRQRREYAGRSWHRRSGGRLRMR